MTKFIKLSLFLSLLLSTSLKAEEEITDGANLADADAIANYCIHKIDLGIKPPMTKESRLKYIQCYNDYLDIINKNYKK